MTELSRAGRGALQPLLSKVDNLKDKTADDSIKSRGKLYD